MEWDETDVLGREDDIPSVVLEEDGNGSIDSEDNQINGQYMSEISRLEEAGLVDIGNLASWKVSSFKQGYGVEALQEDTPGMFWQSDGPQPHNVDIQFSKRVSIERISIFTDYGLDESYTPSKMTLSSGTGYHDLLPVAELELNEPRGWSHIKLDDIRRDGVIKTFLVRLSITSNHQNGKDTHLRALKLFSPQGRGTQLQMESDDELIGWTSIAMKSESTVR